MISSLERLGQNELFQSLTEEEQAKLAPLCSDFVAIEGAIVFLEGHNSSHLYLITEGSVALQKSIRVPHARHPRRTTVTVCRPGESVGWSALVYPHRYTLSAVAWESCKLISVDSKMLRRGLEMYPEIGNKVMKALSEVISRRLRQTTEALINEREVNFAGLEV